MRPWTRVAFAFFVTLHCGFARNQFTTAGWVLVPWRMVPGSMVPGSIVPRAWFILLWNAPLSGAMGCEPDTWFSYWFLVPALTPQQSGGSPV